MRILLRLEGSGDLLIPGPCALQRIPALSEVFIASNIEVSYIVADLVSDGSLL